MADRVIFVCTLILAGVYFYATEKLPSLEIGDPLGTQGFSAAARRSGSS